MKNQSQFTGDAAKIILFLSAGALFIAFLFAISHIVKLVLIAALLAYVLDPLANFLESRGMNRRSATVTIFIVILTFSCISYIILLPVLTGEITALQAGFSVDEAELMVSRLQNFLVSNFGFLGMENLHLSGRIRDTSSKIGEWVFTHILDAASAVTSVILLPFIVFFLLKDGRQFKKSFVTLVPNRYFEFSLYLLYKLNLQVGNYLRGQFLDALTVGILAIFALWLIGVKYFVLIGVFTGLVNLIPYFGPITGAIFAVMVSILQTGNFQMALYVILAFTLIKLADDILIQPMIVSRSVHMHPLTVLLAVLAGGKLFGVLGMLLSVPVVAFIKVVVHESIINYRRYGYRSA